MKIISRKIKKSKKRSTIKKGGLKFSDYFNLFGKRKRSNRTLKVDPTPEEPEEINFPGDNEDDNEGNNEVEEIVVNTEIKPGRYERFKSTLKNTFQSLKDLITRKKIVEEETREAEESLAVAENELRLTETQQQRQIQAVKQWEVYIQKKQEEEEKINDELNKMKLPTDAVVRPTNSTSERIGGFNPSNKKTLKRKNKKG